MTMRGFSATKRWPIVDEHMWNLVPQGNFTYAIVNAKNNMRVLAQSGMAWEQGFFATDSGPIYEDQKWRLELQEDGSYGIINARSGRKILARSGGDEGIGFAAIRSDGPIRDEERWWLINQERDETGKGLLQLETALRKNTKIEAAFKAKVGEILLLTSQLRRAQAKLTQHTTASQSETTRLTQQIRVERQVNLKLSEQIVAKQNETHQALSDLQFEKDAKAQLAGKVHIALRKIHALNSEMQAERSARDDLVEELEARSAVLACLWHSPTDDPVLHTCKLVLLSMAVVVVSILLPCLMQRLRAARGRAATLVVELGTARAANGYLVDENAKKELKIAELEQNLDCLAVSDDLLAIPPGELGFDFAFQVFNIDDDSTTTRFIKIQCPGVAHEDVEVQLIFNGCDVTIARQASRGVEAITWRRQFQFKVSEGLFEFKEDQMQLEHGFLHLVFKAYTFQSRVIRFPKHFSLDSTDKDLCWEFEPEEVAPCEESPIDCMLRKPGSHIDTDSTASTPRMRLYSGL